MPTNSRSSFARSMFGHLYRLVFQSAYRLTIRMGDWWEPLLQEASPASGERILEVSVQGCRAYAKLARAYPTVSFFSLLRVGSKKTKLKSPSNLEFLQGNQYCIDYRASSFDKAICSLALHPLSQNEKLAFLREVRRVLRHGGMLYLADFDQPLRSQEMHVLRGTAHMLGPETARRHLDGTWLELIRQAGFTGVRRMTTASVIGGRIAIVRARRP